MSTLEVKKLRKAIAEEDYRQEVLRAKQIVSAHWAVHIDTLRGRYSAHKWGLQGIPAYTLTCLYHVKGCPEGCFSHDAVMHANAGTSDT